MSKRQAEQRWMTRVAQLPCVVCGTQPVELHHIREGQGAARRRERKAMTKDTDSPPGPGVLLPCPFCGGAACLESLQGLRWVHCSDCYASSVSETDGAVTIAKWNRRAASPEPVREPVAREETCRTCKGSGDATTMTQCHGPDDYEVTVDCPECGGTGATPVEPQSPGVPREHAEQCGFHVGLPCICAVGDPAHDARPQEGAPGGQDQHRALASHARPPAKREG